MELDKWRDEDFVKMKEIERELIDWLLPRVQRVSPLLALFVLVRCARAILRKSSLETQREILPVVEAYLEGRQPSHGPSSVLWTGRESN